MILPRDERIHVDSSRRAWPAAFERHERLDPEHFYGYSGHHGLTGILAAAGPGIRPGRVPAGSEITQLPATLLHLLGLGADDLDGAPIESILADAGGPLAVTSPLETTVAPQSVYSDAEEEDMIERLRDLGYE